VAPQSTDLVTEIVHFITPFSDYQRGSLATHVYPNANISPYAQSLADTTHDVWVGISGGSNPYDGDPCTGQNVSDTFAATGFSYSLNLVSTAALTPTTYSVLSPVAYNSEESLPINGTFSATTASTGHVTVIIDSHGPNDEYEYTQDTVMVNGVQIGSFSTKMNCSSYAQYSPDGNPGIFQNNNGNNPRNWCPGALVPSHTFPVTLETGNNSFSIDVIPSNLSSGDYFQTSINYTSP